MKKQYYRKDKLARVYKCYKVDTEYDKELHVAPTWACEMWCYSSQLSQEATFEAAKYGSNETRFFVFNRCHDIRPGYLVLYRDAWYEVTRSDRTDDYNGDIFVYVRDCTGAGKPKANNVHDFGWLPD